MASLAPLKAELLELLKTTGKRVTATSDLVKKTGQDKGRVLRALKQLQDEKEVMKEAGLKNFYGSLDANWKYNEWR